MAEQHITPSSHSALTRESTRSSPSRVVGGRWLRQVRKANRSRRSRRNGISPLPRSSRHSSSRADNAESRTQVELRRSSRLVSTLPRSDYSISERWSYGTDVYETRYDTAHHKHGDSSKSSSANPKRGRTSSHDRKKHKSQNTSNSNTNDECVAYCTRSRTALKSTESVCEPTPNNFKANSLLRQSTSLNETETSIQGLPLNQSEGGLLPLDERDFAYSPFSSSTITELLDSDYSVYSPTANRRKGKKRKRSTHRSLSHRKNNCLIDIEECRKKFKIDTHREVIESSNNDTIDSSPEYEPEAADLNSSQTSCTYRLRNRHNRDLGTASSVLITVVNTASPAPSDVVQTLTTDLENTDYRKTSTPPPFKDLQEASSSKSSGSKLLIVPRDLPYLRQTNARRSIAAATGATLGACLTRGASTSQRRQDTTSKRQTGEEAGSGAGGGRRARGRDMPQPHTPSTRRDKRGKSSLGSCASTGGASSRSHPQPINTVNIIL